MKQVAVFGGTFNPPTLAHESIITACLALEDMDEVWLMPSGRRTDKADMADSAHRLALLQLIKQRNYRNDPRLIVSDFELNLPQPTQTRRTVEALRKTFTDTRFWFVFGADALADMPSWEDGIVLRQQLPIIAVPRAGCGLPPESSRLKHLRDYNAAHQDCSSTGVREALAAGLPIGHLVSPAVAEYLRFGLQSTDG